MDQPLCLKLFGSPQITYHGQPLTGFVSTKVRALLIYLAVTARPHSRDHLAHLLWEDTPASMKVNLRKALSNLRQLIGDVLVEDGKELAALDMRRCWVDVGEFEQQCSTVVLQDVTQLYRADFLAGFNPSVSYEFEAWALAEQSRLKSLMVDRLRQLATQHEKGNRLSDAIQTVRRLLELEPWHEEAHRQLMALLAKDGQRSAALAHFEVCKRVLQEELAVEPDAETMRLVESIQHSSLVSAVKSQTKPISLPKPEFPLIGREREFQIIQQSWQHCLQHGPYFVAIAGEAGIGKTRLTEEARLWVAEQGYTSAYARSYAAEGALVYSPVVDWLRSEAIRPTLEQLEPIWLGEVTRLLPELLVSQPNLVPPKPINDGLQRRLFFEALARAVTVGNTPLLLVIDDLQWCDRETMEWLRFLLRFDSKQPLLILGGFRVEEVDQDHRVYELLGSLRQREQVTEFELIALNAQDTSKLLHIVTDESMTTSQITALYQATSGHPLFVIESVRSQNDKPNGSLIGKSPKIQNVIQTRLSLLSTEARQLVELAATVGRSFSFQLLQTASKQDESTLYRCLDELWQRRVIVEKESAHFDFSHDRIRETVYANIRPLNRQRLHQQVAEVLEKLYSEDLSEWNGQIAVHYQIAGKWATAMDYFALAVQLSVNRWALDEALVLIEQAMASVPFLAENEVNLRNALTLRALQYEVVTRLKGYMEPQLRDIIEQISHISEKLHDHKGLYLARTKLRLYHSLRAEWVQAKTIAESNIPLAQQTEDKDIISEAYHVLGRVNFYMGDLELAKSRYDQGNAILVTLNPQIQRFDKGQPPQVNAFNNTAHCYFLLGYLAQAEQWTNRALMIAETSNHHHALVEGLHFNLLFLFLARQVGSLQSKAEKMFATAQQHNLTFHQEMSKIHLAWAYVNSGQVDQGIEQLKRSISYFANLRLGMFHVKRLGMLIESYRKAYRYKEGIETVHEALAFAERTSDQFWVPELYRLQGELLLGNGATNYEVENSYKQSLTISRQQSSRLFELRTSVSLARLWQSQGKQTEAYQLLAPIYTWFTEGFDTPDLIEAKQMLDELKSTPPCPIN